VHLAYIWIVSHLSAKNYRNLWKFDEVLTHTNLLSFFGTRCIHAKMIGGATSFTWNFGSKWPRWSEIADFRSIFAHSASAV